MVRHLIIIVFLSFFISGKVCATHNRAGEITIKQTGDLTIEVTVTTYTKTTSTQADRDSVRVFWGDGSSEFIYRTNGEGTPLANNRKLNYYVASHTFPGRATYTISMMDPNRNGGIINVNPPNSEGVPFYIEATYTFLNPQFQGYNNTAILLQQPIDFGCVGQKFIHNPTAYDPDGDSLAFEFIVPLQDSGVNVPNYIFPQNIVPGPNNSMTLDPVTGNLVWDSPQFSGEYNIAFRVKEYRGGVLISSFIRDMQILVLICDNSPPDVEAVDEVCVIAGHHLELNVLITDPDSGQLVAVTAEGGPFEVPGNKAILETGGTGFQSPPVFAKLIWDPQCEHIRDQPYSVIIKGVDNFFDTTGLVDLHSIRIKVIGPPPEDVTLDHASDAFELSWLLPYSCENTTTNYFKGFSIWKRNGSNQFQLDSCDTGLEGRGYTKIASNWKGIKNGRYFFEDKDISNEGSYCYRILAEFAQTTPSGQPYLRVLSIPSEEACLRAKADRPLLTNVSVEATDVTAGKIKIKWIGPETGSIDTFLNPGPYVYQLMRANEIDGINFQPVAGGSFSSPTLSGLKDSLVLDQNLDTRSLGYTYRLDMLTGDPNTLFGSSQAASSVFLMVAPSDEANLLSWKSNTPWDNYEYEIWRSDQGSAFSLITTTEDENYADRQNVVNGLEYCYRIIALGNYGLTSVPSPLINQSQDVCSIPVDNVAPCPPEIEVSNICDQADPGTPADAFINYLTWKETCPDDDIAGYKIFFSPEPGSPMILVGTVNANEHHFEHKPGEKIAGCYSIITFDQKNNESQSSNVVCVNNCPVFELPNAFTPNGDGQNDIFKPLSARFIESIDFKVFNRWGQVVFTTSDPQINWNGTNKSGKDVSDGVYFYTCRAFESQNLPPIVLSGYIELIRG
ncbi:MAG: gliding motility-associated C-terminal domain-containing protein [Saprospiraceae bacterium]|uniref:Gliding motility-associated C-terminal domain-containing protein n=1 Tax=Candidatus Opimibacter skivensis TaxID=2982028 RepID=A0A9D7XTZ9_9BACT|nr:gliding motility-associated C-terminal domain-containing protein [Candidatus Opimibacter skivensis]